MAAVLLVLLLILAGFVAWIFVGTKPSSAPVSPAEAQARAAANNGINPDQHTILVIGVDGDGESMAAQRSDTIILTRIIGDRVDMVSIPRDLLVPMPGCTGRSGEEKINGIFAYSSGNSGLDAGAHCLMSSVTAFSGVPIDDYLIVNMNSVVSMVDELGGVEICLDPQEVEQRVVPDFTAPGCHEMNGTQAMQYARARKYVGDGTDLQRMNRQHVVLAAMVKKARQVNPFGDIPKVLSLASKMNEMTVSSLGFTDARKVTGFARTLAGADLTAAVTIPIMWAEDGVNLRLSPESRQYFTSLQNGTPLPAKP